ncbi:hypothetical protein ABZP36_034926 [Zizania latifolia]
MPSKCTPPCQDGARTSPRQSSAAGGPLERARFGRAKSRGVGMSGTTLWAALIELGFDGKDPLATDTLEWPFQYEEAHPLLVWIYSFLHPSNILSPSHLAQ